MTIKYYTPSYLKESGELNETQQAAALNHSLGLEALKSLYEKESKKNFQSESDEKYKEQSNAFFKEVTSNLNTNPQTQSMINLSLSHWNR